MRVRVFSPPGGVCLVRPVEETREVLNALSFPSKAAMAPSWTPISVTLDWTDQNDPRTRRVMADFPTPNFRALVMTQTAKVILHERLSPYGEFLPLECPDAELYAFNVTRIVEALDISKSTLANRENVNPEAPLLLKAAFLSEKLVGVDVFRLPQRNQVQTYFTDTFHDAVAASGLTGFGSRIEWEG